MNFASKCNTFPTSVRNLIIHFKLVHKPSMNVWMGYTQLTHTKLQREIKAGLKKQLLYYSSSEARCARRFSIWWMYQKTEQPSEMMRSGQDRPGQANYMQYPPKGRSWRGGLNISFYPDGTERPCGAAGERNHGLFMKTRGSEQRQIHLLSLMGWNGMELNWNGNEMTLELNGMEWIKMERNWIT